MTLPCAIVFQDGSWPPLLHPSSPLLTHCLLILESFVAQIIVIAVYIASLYIAFSPCSQWLLHPADLKWSMFSPSQTMAPPTCQMNTSISLLPLITSSALPLKVPRRFVALGVCGPTSPCSGISSKDTTSGNTSCTLTSARHSQLTSQSPKPGHSPFTSPTPLYQTLQPHMKHRLNPRERLHTTLMSALSSRSKTMSYPSTRFRSSPSSRSSWVNTRQTGIDTCKALLRGITTWSILLHCRSEGARIPRTAYTTN